MCKDYLYSKRARRWAMSIVWPYPKVCSEFELGVCAGGVSQKICYTTFLLRTKFYYTCRYRSLTVTEYTRLKEHQEDTSSLGSQLDCDRRTQCGWSVWSIAGTAINIDLASIFFTNMSKDPFFSQSQLEQLANFRSEFQAGDRKTRKEIRRNAVKAIMPNDVNSKLKKTFKEVGSNS